MELSVQVWNLNGRVNVEKIAKTIDQDAFEIYAFHQSSRTKISSLTEKSDLLKSYTVHDIDDRSTNVLFVNPTKFVVVSTESLGNVGDLYEVQKIGDESQTMFLASLSMEAIPARSIAPLIKTLRNDGRLLNGTLMVSAKYNSTKFKELMSGRIDLKKDKDTFTYVHRVNDHYNVQMVKSMFGGGSTIMPSAMKLSKPSNTPVHVRQEEVNGLQETPVPVQQDLYYGVRLNRDSTLKPLSRRHGFVALSHEAAFTDAFDGHLTFRTEKMTSFVKKEGFELIDAVYEASDTVRLHAIYGKRYGSTILLVNINMDTNIVDILQATFVRLGIQNTTLDSVVIAGTFPEKYPDLWKPFEGDHDARTLRRIDAYSKYDTVYTLIG